MSTVITGPNGGIAAVMDAAGGSTPVGVKFNGDIRTSDDVAVALQRRLDRVEVKMEDLRSLIAIQQGTIASMRDELERIRLGKVAR